MIRIELSLRLPNSPGALAGVCRLLSDERVNVQALSLDAGGQLRMVIDNHEDRWRGRADIDAGLRRGTSPPSSA